MKAARSFSTAVLALAVLLIAGSAEAQDCVVPNGNTCGLWGIGTIGFYVEAS
jgi:hypothetical protein